MPIAPGTQLEIGYLFRLNIIGDVHNQLTQTGFHFSVYGAKLLLPPQQVLSELMTHFSGLVMPAFRNCCSDEWRARSLIGYSMIPRKEALFEIPQPFGAGDQESVSLPSFNAVCLRLRTGFGGRSRSGSIHMPGVARDLVVNSRLEDSYAARFRNLRDVLLGAYGPTGSSNSFLWGVYSRAIGDAQPQGPGGTIFHDLEGFYPIIAVFVEEKIGTILKRKVGRGE